MMRPRLKGVSETGQTLIICELYKSIQGEGRLTGTESIFVRTSGCNLRCGFCDTPFSSWNPEGQKTSVEKIVQDCLDLECSHVVLTGGEPMLQKSVVDLTRQLTEHGLHITIETAGTIDHPVACDLISISPKLSNSTPDRQRAGDWQLRHERDRFQPKVIAALTKRYQYQIKFVVDQPADCDEILKYLASLKDEHDVAIDPNRVMLMPQGIDEPELSEREPWIERFCAENQFQLCRRMHIVWFGNKRGT